METDTPGILLTERDETAGWYNLTHRHSGMSINSKAFAATHDVFGLLEVAKALGKVANWRRHAKSLHTKQTRDGVLKVLREAKCEWVAMKESEHVMRASRRVLGLS